MTTPDGYTQQTEYDVLNRVRRTVDKTSRATVYNYDDPLFLTSIVDAKQQRYAFQPNAFGWVEVETDPRQLHTRYGYDAGGNLTSVVNRRQQTVTFAYDDLNRLSSRTADGATTTYSTDPTGRWAAAANAESVDTSYFDVAGRASSAVTVRPGGARHVLVYQSDERNRLVNLTSTNWNVRYQYSVRDVLDTLFDAAGLRTMLSHNSDDQLVETALPMGVRVLTNYPPTHAQSGLTYRPQMLDDSLGVGYVRDSLARIITRLNNQGNRGRDYVYDPVGRLIRTRDFTIDDPNGICTPIYQSIQPAPDEEPIGFECPDTTGRHVVDSTTYTYDEVGNRTDNAAVVETGNRLTRFGRWALEYDDDGNLTRKYDPSCPTTCDRRFWWNSLGLLDSAFTSESGTVRYGYDGLGRRIRRTASSGGAQFYVYDGDNLWRETDAGGAIVREYAYYSGVDTPHSMRMNGQLYYFQQDGSGNVAGLIRSDGTLERKVSYGPFGSLAAGSSPVVGFGFKSREHDPATELVYMRARWYDSELARFISEDPIGLGGGYNLYVFTDDDPINGADPSGLCDASDATVIRYERDEDGNWVETRICSGGDNSIIIHGRAAPFMQFVRGVATRTAAVEGLVDRLGELAGVNDLGRAGDRLLGGDVVGGGIALALALPSGPGKARYLARAKGPLPTKYARELAAYLGYTRLVKDPPFNSRGMAVFSNGVTMITIDRDAHLGGVWKMLNRAGERLGTFDALLNFIAR